MAYHVGSPIRGLVIRMGEAMKLLRAPLLLVIAVWISAMQAVYAQTTEAAKPAKPSRLALVIGNAAYKSDPLPNPANDAADMAALLRQAG
jgi:hypothetical protein